MSLRLRAHTAASHRRAEQGGIVREILRGQATLRGYTLYLRNLLPAYAALEAGLARHAAAPGVRLVAFPALARSAAIIADLAALAGPDWRSGVALLDSGRAYGARVAACAERGAARLVAHGYTRSLGDLSGAQMLRRSLARRPGIPASALSFYDFPAIADADDFKAEYRRALDAVADEVHDIDAILDEAQAAFACNIAVSEETLQALAD